MTAEQERAAVVAFLRGLKQVNSWSLGQAAVAATARSLALCIERGEHLAKPE